MLLEGQERYIIKHLSVKNESREKDSNVTCYNCEGKGHIARHCRKPKKRFERKGLIKERNGNSNTRETSFDHRRAAADRRSSLLNNENLEFLRLRVDISKENELLFLIDTGADISIVKGTKLIGTTVYNPNRKVQVKCVDGSPMETHGVLEARIELKNSLLVHNFQLLNKQVDIPCDGILGRDFLQLAKAKLCYELRTVTLNGEVCQMVGKMEQLELNRSTVRKMGQIKLPPQTESIVKVPMTPGSLLVGMTNKCKIEKGVIIAASLTRVVDGCAITSILNTNDTEVNVQEPLVELDDVDLTWERDSCTEFESQDGKRYSDPTKVGTS